MVKSATPFQALAPIPFPIMTANTSLSAASCCSFSGVCYCYIGSKAASLHLIFKLRCKITSVSACIRKKHHCFVALLRLGQITKRRTGKQKTSRLRTGFYIGITQLQVS